MVAEPRIRTAAVVLAAGSSQRMGAANKLQLPIDGMPLIRRSLLTLIQAGIDDIVVVLGYEQESTRALIDDLPLDIVVNEAHASGQMSSVHCGLNALQETYDAIVIALGDQPALQSADIEILIDAFAHRDGAEVVVPTYQGERGNPIVISASCRADIVAGTRNLGCRKFIDKNPQLVQKIEMSSPAFVIDLDTPTQYEDFCNSANSPDADRLTQQAS